VRRNEHGHLAFVEVACHTGVGVTAEGDTALPGRFLGREVVRIDRRRKEEVSEVLPILDTAGKFPKCVRAG
jgi:hypothetical protein